MKNIILLPLIFLIHLSFAYSEAGKGIISGKILDGQTDEAMEFATISVFRESDSTLVNGGITDTEGNFEIPNLPFGNYYLKAKFIGFEAQLIQNIEIDRDNKHFKIPDLRLFPGDENLPEVVVSGQRNFIDYKIDKKIVNVSQHANAAGGTVADVLENVPSVAVDIDGNVTLRGSSAFTVLIDGKPTVMTGSDMLKQIPANTVENIEVITNPSAKYDPEGNTGIINLIMKKGFSEGLNGIVSANYATWDKIGGDATLNYRKEKVNYFLIGNYSKRPMHAVSENRRETRFVKNNNFLNEKTERTRTFRPFRINPGIDLYLNNKNTLSISGTFGGWGMDRLFDTEYEILEESSSSKDYSISDNEFHIDGIYYVGNVNFQHIFDKKEHKLDLSAITWTWDGNNTEESFEQTANEFYEPIDFLSANRSDLHEDRDHYQFKIDYTLPLGQGKFEAGAEARLMYQNSHLLFEDKNEENGPWQTNPEFTYETNFHRNIYSAYSTFSGTLDWFNYQVGLRTELTDRLMTQVGADTKFPVELFKLYPSLHLSKDLQNNQQLQLSYSRRVNRPQHWQLNPFPGYSDTYNYFQGNPQLKPEDTDAFELNYINRFEKMILSAGLFYRLTTNTQDMLQSIKPENPTLIYLTFDNISETKSAGLEWMINYFPNRKFNLNCSGNTYRYELFSDFDGESREGKSINWDTRINLSYNITKSTKVQFITVYNSPSVRSQGTAEALYYFDLAVRQSFLKRKLNVSLHGHNILSTGKFVSEVENDDFYSWFSYKGESPVVRLNVSYMINNYERKQRENADIGAGAN